MKSCLICNIRFCFVLKFLIWYCICIIGYANFGSNGNFHLLHFAVHQTKMIENRYLILIFCIQIFSQYQIRLKYSSSKYNKKVFFIKRCGMMCLNIFFFLYIHQKSHLNGKNAKNLKLLDIVDIAWNCIFCSIFNTLKVIFHK